MKKPFLYLVTPPIGKDFFTWEEMIKKAVLGGVSVVQIRDKNASSDQLFQAAKKLSPFLKEHNALLIINDHVDLAILLEADGVHLGQSDLSTKEARANLKKNAIIGLSLESLDDLKKPFDADYLAASPVFASQTKIDTKEPWGIEGLRQLKNHTPLPLVAIGGIQPYHTRSLIEAGATGIAVVSAIASAPCPFIAAQSFIIEMGET